MNIDDDGFFIGIIVVLFFIFMLCIGNLLFNNDENEPVYECKTYEEQETCTTKNVCVEQVCVENCE